MQPVGPSDYARKLLQLQKKLRIRVRRRHLLEAALTHPSFWGDSTMTDAERLDAGYERLEFLGDSVIGLTVCNELFRRHTDFDQGKLSKIKSYLVSGQTLAKTARRIGLTEYIRFGKGMSNQPDSVLDSFLADCLESLVGAFYIDRGFPAAQKFVLRLLEEEMESAETPEEVEDAKTALQELVQKEWKEVPRYKPVSESGPDHRKQFVVKVTIGGVEWGRGEGFSKKEAERAAAVGALAGLKQRRKDGKRPKSSPAAK